MVRRYLIKEAALIRGERAWRTRWKMDHTET